MLNKKGFTIAEVIVSFSLVSIILASVVASTVYYRQKVKDEEVITQLIDFKNSITTAIYDDILPHDGVEIVSVERCIGTSNCVNFVDSGGNSHTLKIIELTEQDSNNSRGVYLSYNNIKYMLPDSDLGTGDERVCDFIGGFNIDYYEDDEHSLYTVTTDFKHKDLNLQYTIMATITNYNDSENTD